MLLARAFSPLARRQFHSFRVAMATTSKETVFLDSIRDIADDYDLFLLDMWGVMHNGSHPYDGVLDTVKELKKAGKEMIILSNSSKRTDASIRSLKKLGFDPSDFAQIITSGEVSVMLCSSRTCS